MDFGISTLSIPGISIEETITLVREAGFTALEFVPYSFKSPGDFSREERIDLSKRLSESFNRFTLHSSIANGADLHSKDADKKKKSLQEYTDLLEFGIDIGSNPLSFHQTSDEFEEIGMKYSQEYGVHILIESFDVALNGSGRPFMLYDVGHAALEIQEESKLNEALLDSIGKRISGIKEFHFHGVITEGERWEDHQPLHEYNLIDYVKIVKLLQENNYNGLIIFEIGIREKENQKGNIESSRLAREMLLKGNT